VSAVIDVEKLRFEFDDQWTAVEKWDDAAAFKDGIRKLNGEVWNNDRKTFESVGAKAVDIVGVLGRDLYVIEVKDFRGHPETTKQQVQGRSLEIACKVRDTVAGLVGPTGQAGCLGSESARGGSSSRRGT
jgi:hypothetical protein